MKTVTINIYNIQELTEDAKINAYHEWLNEGHDNPFEMENRQSFDLFCDIFNIRNNVPRHNEDVLNLSGIRLLSYLWNNYRKDLYKGRYFSLWSETDINPHYRPGGNAPKGKLKSRRSKVMLDETCALTGYCMDDEILQPIRDFMKSPDARTFEGLLNDCISAYENAVQNDNDHYFSIEHFIELAEVNDWEFNECGEFYS